MSLRRLRLVVTVAVACGLPVGAVGCAFDGVIAVQFRGTSPTVVTESSMPDQIPHVVTGVTTRRAQVVGIDCSVTLVYDIREATGRTVLAQTYVLHLRTRRLPRRTAYAFNCTGPLVVEVPADASAVQATAAGASAPEAPLTVRSGATSLPLAFGKRLRPDAGTQLVVVGWPPTLPGGQYRVELSFSLPESRAFREKAVETASVSCGRSRYLQPILPTIGRMARAPGFTIHPSADPIVLPLPRVAGAIGSYAEAKRTLSCTKNTR
jgi:hypothetical protein